MHGSSLTEVVTVNGYPVLLNVQTFPSYVVNVLDLLNGSWSVIFRVVYKVVIIAKARTNINPE